MQYHDAKPPQSTDSSVLNRPPSQIAHDNRATSKEIVEGWVWHYFRQRGHPLPLTDLIHAISQDTDLYQGTIETYLDALSSWSASAPFVTNGEGKKKVIDPKDAALLDDDGVDDLPQPTPTPPTRAKAEEGGRQCLTTPST